MRDCNTQTAVERHAVGLMGALTMTGAHAQETAQATATIADADNLQVDAVAACVSADSAACRAALAAYSAVVAQLVASGLLTNDAALERFQAVRDGVRAGGGTAVIDEIFEELFPDTAAVSSSSPA